MAPAPFVVGVGRSGTTLLRMMLDAHPEVSIPPETSFFRTLRLGLPAQGDPHEFFLATVARVQQWNSFGLDLQTLAKAVGAIQPFHLGEALRVFYRAYAARFSKLRWGDKTPANLLEMEEIQRVLPEARFLHLIRDGRDVAVSLGQVWWGPGTVRESAEEWVRLIREARHQCAHLRHYLEVRYEALVRHPRRTLEDVCAFLELPWNDVVLDYHLRAAQRLEESRFDYRDGKGRLVATAAQRVAALERTTHPPDVSRIGRWRSAMSQTDCEVFVQVAGDLLRDLGYQVA